MKLLSGDDVLYIQLFVLQVVLASSLIYEGQESFLNWLKI